MDERLIGEWELIKIEKHNQTLIPEQGKYNLIITKTSIRYNLEVNSCWLRGWSIESNEILSENIPCTRVCCDDRKGTFYKNLQYTGHFKVSESRNFLTINNEKGTFFLSRKK